MGAGFNGVEKAEGLNLSTGRRYLELSRLPEVDGLETVAVENEPRIGFTTFAVEAAAFVNEETSTSATVGDKLLEETFPLPVADAAFFFLGLKLK